MPPYAELSQERMGVWKRTPLFLRRGDDDRDGYENRLCEENWRHDFRCHRNARSERKAHARGDCKGSDCKRSNGFAGSGYCLIGFTRNYVLWGFFKKYLKTTWQKDPIQPSFIRKDRTIEKCGSRDRSVKLASAHDTWRADAPGKIGIANIEKAPNRVSSACRKSLFDTLPKFLKL